MPFEKLYVIVARILLSEIYVSPVATSSKVWVTLLLIFVDTPFLNEVLIPINGVNDLVTLDNWRLSLKSSSKDDIPNKLIGAIPSSLNFHDKFCLPENACSKETDDTYGFIKLIFSNPPILKDQFKNGKPLERLLPNEI